MTESDRFHEIERLFMEVCELDPSAREARLIELAPGDVALRSEVLELLAAEARADQSRGFTPEAVLAEIGQTLHASDQEPEELAGYRIISRLGEGGMGVVYEAEQRSPRRTVALKVLRPGLATPERVRRFEFEVETLGRLRHPGIAQVYEAGIASTPAGPRPFFAMELIDGVPLDKWGARAATRDRLEMMARICDAVQHAHAQGVVHRDLKPANILVTPEGEPKVLDFGVARTMDADARADSMQTLQGQLVGTLPYMSPEQLSGEPGSVDTRADVYALGVVLFELMSGRLPHEVSDQGLLDAARTIREQPPTRLATLEPRLRGDVDTIVGKALERDRERRYATAAAMGDDITRHLAGLTIAARPPSAVYQLSRLARRHVPAVVAGAVVLVALVGSVVGVSLALSEAIDQRDLAQARLVEAERQTSIAQNVTGFLNNDVLAAIEPNALGKDATVRQAIDAAAANLGDRFADEPATGAAIRNNIANVYRTLGEYDLAVPLTLQARDMFTASLGPDHKLTRFATQDLGALYEDMGRYDESRQILTDLLKQREAAIGASDPETLETMIMLAEVERDGFGDLTRATEWLDEYDSRRRGVIADDDRIELYATLVRGGVALNMRDFETAASCYERVAGAREAALGPENSATIVARHNLATALEGLGRYDEAEPIYKRNLEIERRQAGADNPNTLISAHNLAFLYESMGRYEEAEPLYLDTLERCKQVFGPTHPGTLTCTQSLASLYRQTGRLDESLELLEGALSAARAEMGPDAPPSIEIAWKLGVVYAESDRTEDAEALLASTLPAAREMLPPEHPMLGSMLVSWGECLSRLGKDAEALATLGEAHEILRVAGGTRADADARKAASLIADLHRRAGQTDEAARWQAISAETTGD